MCQHNPRARANQKGHKHECSFSQMDYKAKQWKKMRSESANARANCIPCTRLAPISSTGGSGGSAQKVDGRSMFTGWDVTLVWGGKNREFV